MLEIGKTEQRIWNLIRENGTICAALIDPEDFTPREAARRAKLAEDAGAKLILVGGSTLTDQSLLDDTIVVLKEHVTSPVVLFPGNITGVSRHADAILFSCLLNSLNPYFIVGAQALGALQVYKSKLESIPMGYIVFGQESATSFIGQVNPLPSTKPGLAIMYSLAARYFGMRALYLEAGSGAPKPVPAHIISAVRKYYDGLLVVGGGITNGERARVAARAGADIVVIGNLLAKRDFHVKVKGVVEAISKGFKARAKRY